ncbi:MAG: SAM-dependent methyltransferase [Planctomycetales bacterium 12-60-4]|nr:MAG: SAM-dependent methyltransferase [Planctomycetales bacterium 12-60-4]
MDPSMTFDTRLESARFPRASCYHPEWLIGSASGGANSLWLTEWLTEALDLQPGMRVLDLGCGRAATSIFLGREFGVQVWAVDLWFNVTENSHRIRDAGLDHSVFPLHADARALPFAGEFFDAIVSLDSFFYYGTDDLYLSYLARFLKPGGHLGIAGAGLMAELDGRIPDHLQGWWDPSLWSLHSAEWWSQHWARSGLVDVALSDSLPDGWQYWLQWQQVICPENTTELQAVQSDAGRTLGYVRTVARRRADAVIDEPLASIPGKYHQAPLLKQTDN